MQFQMNDKVEWTSSNAHKFGRVIAIVPIRKLPRDIGYPQVGLDASPRDHESYVVRGGEMNRKTKLYWPMVSPLRPLSGLTTEEINWCHHNAGAVRKLMEKP